MIGDSIIMVSDSPVRGMSFEEVTGLLRDATVPFTCGFARRAVPAQGHAKAADAAPEVAAAPPPAEEPVNGGPKRAPRKEGQGPSGGGQRRAQQQHQQQQHAASQQQQQQQAAQPGGYVTEYLKNAWNQAPGGLDVLLDELGQRALQTALGIRSKKDGEDGRPRRKRRRPSLLDEELDIQLGGEALRALEHVQGRYMKLRAARLENRALSDAYMEYT
jgi:hypothetical protein